MPPSITLWQAILVATVSEPLTHNNAIGATLSLSDALAMSLRQSVNCTKS